MIPPSYNKPLMDYSSAFYHRNIMVGVLPPHNKNLLLQLICVHIILFSLLNRLFLPSSAQAQGQLEAELALFSLDPAPHHHPHPPVKVYLAAYINQVVTKLQCKAY